MSKKAGAFLGALGAVGALAVICGLAFAVLGVATGTPVAMRPLPTEPSLAALLTPVVVTQPPATQFSATQPPAVPPTPSDTDTLIIAPHPNHIQSSPLVSSQYIFWTELELDSTQNVAPTTNQIRAVNVQTGENTAVTDAHGERDLLEANGSTAVWADNPHPGCNSGQNGCSYSLLRKDLSEGRVFTITPSLSINVGLYPQIAGGRIAWIEGSTHKQIYLQDYRSHQTTHVATLPDQDSAQYSSEVAGPFLSDKYLVWALANPPSSTQQSERTYTIYAYNIETHETRPVMQNNPLPPSSQLPNFAVSGVNLIWAAQMEPPLHYLNLDTGEKAILTTDYVVSMAVSGDTVAWYVDSTNSIWGMKLGDRHPVQLVPFVDRARWVPSISMEGDWLAWQEGAFPGYIKAIRLSPMFANPPTPAPTPPPPPPTMPGALPTPHG